MAIRDESSPKLLTTHDALESSGVRVSDDDRRLLLSLSEKYGVPGIDVTALTLTLTDLALIPREIARRHVVLPLLVKDDSMFLAMANPGDARALEEIEFVSGKHVFPYVTDPDALAGIIDQAYDLHARGATVYVGERVASANTTSASPSTPPRAPSSPAVIPPAPSASGAPPRVASRDASGGRLRGGRRPTLVGPAPVVPVPPGPPPSRTQPPPPSPLSRPTPPRPSVTALQTPGAQPGSAAATSSSAPSRVSIPMSSPQRVVLLIDAHPEARRQIKAALEASGPTVLEAATASEALAVARTRTPDLIVMDPSLPDEHGFDLCRWMLQHERLALTPVVVISSEYKGWRMQRDLEAVYDIKALVEKPVAVPGGLRKILRVLEREKEPSPDFDALPPVADEALKAGNDAWQRGEIDTAIQHLERGLAVAPRSYRMRYNLGLLLGRRGETFRAIRELEISAELNPSFFQTLKNLAVLYEKAGFRRKALEFWERACDAAPDETTREQIKERVLSLL